MVFRITNFCDMGCSHCMEESTTKGEHATIEIIDKMIKFAQSSKANGTIQISGGEPTSHPLFKEILGKVLASFPLSTDIYILSNGEFFVTDKDMADFITYSMCNYPNLKLQITSVLGLYPEDRFAKIKESIAVWENDSINQEIRSRFLFETELFHGVIPVGRALRNKKSIEKVSYISDRSATSCFNMYSAFQHFGGRIFDTIDHVKTHSKTSLCKPLITEKGLVKFGEYEICSNIVDLSQIKPEDINREMRLDISSVEGACGGCISNIKQVEILREHLHYEKMFSKFNI